jgi:hypothetical protein
MRPNVSDARKGTLARQIDLIGSTLTAKTCAAADMHKAVRPTASATGADRGLWPTLRTSCREIAEYEQSR